MGRIHGIRDFGPKQMCGVNMAMATTVVRCPYCVSDNEFRQMIAGLDGRFVCNKCGHSAIPSGEHFTCSCRKCLELRDLDLHRVA